MNSNTHIRSLNNSNLFTSPLTIYTHLIPHITNPVYNPTIADFERLIPHYEQYFEPTPNSLKITNLISPYKNIPYYYISAFNFLNTPTILV